jgi:hypothetical protein
MYDFMVGVLIVDIGPRLAPWLTPRRSTLVAAAAIVLFFSARPARWVKHQTGDSCLTPSRPRC